MLIKFLKAGDPVEAKSIYNSYCALPGRTEILPIGSVKSNIGHTEGCSGLASIIKVCLAYENETLPGNINIKELRQEIKQFCPPLLPENTNSNYKPGIYKFKNIRYIEFGIVNAFQKDQFEILSSVFFQKYLKLYICRLKKLLLKSIKESLNRMNIYTYNLFTVNLRICIIYLK